MLRTRTRLARKDDVRTIEALIYEWSRSQWPNWHPERTKTILDVLEDKNHLVLVSEIDEEIIGILHLIFYSDILHGSSNCHLNFLLVKEGYRGKRIGSGLLDEAVKQAKKRCSNEMHVDTIFEEAAKFYRKHGFKDNGVWLELSLSDPSATQETVQS